MNETITIHDSFTLKVTPGTLEQWLISYYISKHPEDEPSVWVTYEPGEVSISYHAPPDGRISLIGNISAPEKLLIRSISFRSNWKKYSEELLEAICRRWAIDINEASLSNKLFEILDTKFDEEELRTLCFQMKIKYDDLPAKGMRNKARELIAFLERRERIEELVTLIKRERPEISW